MKRIAQLIALALLAVTLTGCKTPPLNTAGKLISSTALTVDAAMRGWATYVVTANVPEADQAKVKLAYQQYQLAMQAAQTAYVVLANGGDQNAWAVASAALVASSGALTALITSITTGHPPPTK